MSVHFGSAEEDARRRDFTINGMFYDPIAERLIDYIGGADDLRRGVVRAIGDPVARLEEDKLRMLRAPSLLQGHVVDDEIFVVSRNKLERGGGGLLPVP